MAECIYVQKNKKINKKDSILKPNLLVASYRGLSFENYLLNFENIGKSKCLKSK